MANARNHQAKTPAQMAHELIQELIALTSQQIADVVAKRRDCEFMDQVCPDDVCSRYIEFLHAAECIDGLGESDLSLCDDHTYYYHYHDMLEKLMVVIRTQAVTQDLVVENSDKLEANISTLVAAFDDPDSPDCRKYANGLSILREAVEGVRENPSYRPENQIPAPPRQPQKPKHSQPQKPKHTRTGWRLGYGMLAGAAVGTVVAVGLIVAGVLTLGTVPAIAAAIGIGVGIGAACGVIGVGAVTAKIDEVRDKAYQVKYDAYLTQKSECQSTHCAVQQQIRQGSSSARRSRPHTARPVTTYGDPVASEHLAIPKRRKTKIVSTAPISPENTPPSNSSLR